MRFVSSSTFSASVLLFWKAATFAVAQQPSVDLDCNPCIDRARYRIQAFYGTIGSKFWDQVEAPAKQAAKDLGVQLDITRFENYNPQTMATAIRNIISSVNRPDALITTIPDPVVANAVQEVINAGIPVFGLNSGYKLAQDLGVLAWVAQDEVVAGEQAAATFMAVEAGALGPDASLVFVNHEPGNAGLADRLSGFNNFAQMKASGYAAVELNLDPTQDDDAQIQALLGGCTYDFVLLAGSQTLDETLSVLQANGCNTRVASFDESNTLFNGLRDGSVDFGMSQQQHLQGMMPVVFAATYITTGKVPAIPSRNPNRIYMSNGIPWTTTRLPSIQRQQCIEDSFPVCPSVGATGCPCFDRSSVRIGGVLHGDTQDVFWDNVFAGAAVAAGDMGVQLELERFEPSASVDILNSKMNAALAKMCSGDNPVDGLFVSIPNQSVIPTINQCKSAGIPVIAVNSGAIEAENLNLQHFVGQLELTAGFTAGEELVAAGATKLFCLNHNPGVSTLNVRCEGFQTAIEAVGGAEFGGQVIVDVSSPDEYLAAVEAAVGEAGTWTGIGLLLTGSTQGPLGLQVLTAHPNALIGTFDTSQVIFDALESSQYLFAIDQQPYFQGYLPIPLLTVRIQANRQLLNFFVESGPSFTSSAPSAGEQICQDNSFQVCDGTNQCAAYNERCSLSSDCCSNRCVFSVCKKRVSLGKTKLGAEGRGGAAGRVGGRLSGRRVRGMA